MKTPGLFDRQRSGKRGYQISAMRKPDPELGTAPLDHEERDSRPIIPDPGTLPEHPAYIGCSVSTSMKTKFAREGVDVAVWCTLPCSSTPESRADAFEEAKHMCLEDVGRLMTETLDKFFPDFGEHDSERDS